MSVLRHWRSLFWASGSTSPSGMQENKENAYTGLSHCSPGLRYDGNTCIVLLNH